MKIYHLTYTELGWKLKLEGAEYSTRIYKTDKDTAVKESSFLLIKFGEPSSLRIHNTDGTFQEERTYSNNADSVESRS